MSKNIILIGMMGCGKTTIGKELAKSLTDFKYVDLDEEIEKSTQKKISEIFLKHGEPYFRILESDKIKKFSSLDNQIICTGGGAFENEENRKNLSKNGIVFYLKAAPQEIYDRIKSETHRPLLRKDFSVEKIEKIMKLRQKNYEKANFIIDTNKKTPYNIVQEILKVAND